MKRWLFMLWLPLAAGIADAGPSVAIALRPQARVAGPVVTLGEVAVLESSELEPLRALANLPLGRVPAAGETVTLQRDAVARWLRAKTGLADEGLRWTGPASMSLAAAVRRLGGEEIAGAAEAELRHWLDARAQGSDLQLQALPRDLEVPEGELRLRPRPLDGMALRTRMLVWVDVWVSERHVRAVAVPFQVAGGPLLPSVLGDLTVAPAQVDMRSSRPVAAAPAVRRGEWASLHSGVGGIALEARVEVLQDGRLGDKVRVRQPGADGAVFARVTGPAQLELAR